jgi:DNA-binding transcriptional regulator YhcF (GntR family)
MLLTVSPDSPEPIYEQIVTQIIFAVASGDLLSGSLLPTSVRELAEQLLVHPNTVAKAFQELEQRGVLEARRGRGMEIRVGAVNRCRQQRRQIIEGRIRRVLREAASSGLPAAEIRRLVDEELESAAEKQFVPSGKGTSSVGGSLPRGVLDERAGVASDSLPGCSLPRGVLDERGATEGLPGASDSLRNGDQEEAMWTPSSTSRT